MVKKAKKRTQAATKKKTVSKASSKAGVKTVAKRAPKAPAAAQGKGITGAKERARVQDMLYRLRDRVTGQISFLAKDSLSRVDETPTEDRTDDFDREFALNLVSSEHDALFEIDDALRRLESGAYGICEACGCKIEKARLNAIPFARMCVHCQSKMERGRARFKPFGSTIFDAADRPAESVVAEDEESE